MTSEPTRCGYIAFLGAPNAGKSTLLNALVGEKIAIVTPKAQTTRNRITGALIEQNAQLILIDAPGVFEPPATKGFERAMVSAAWEGVADADVICVLIDARKGMSQDNEALLKRLAELNHNRPVLLVFNKIDLVAKARLLELTSQFHEMFGPFTGTYYISALKHDGLADLTASFVQYVPQGPWLYPEDYLTDLPQRLLASEVTREKLFMALRDELPYSVHVETEQWLERADGSIKIDQVIYVERAGQKKILLGKNGSQLKEIGQSARRDLQSQLNCKVHLFLFVKVRDKWKQNPEQLRYLGLQ